MINVFFSMDNGRSSSCPLDTNAYTLNTFQLQFDPIANKVTSPQNAAAATIQFAINKDDAGYILETALAWSELDFFMTQKPNLMCRKIGFDIGVSDVDEEGIIASQLMWNQCCSNRNQIEATNFGTLILSIFDGCFTAIKELDESEPTFSVYPNPSKGSFTVNVSNRQGEMKISNMLGEIVQKQTLDQVNSLVKVSGLTSGIYILEVNNGTRVTTQKILVE